jgi:ABC-type uncharacterized transport system involved in gliding motility auxiliary subunit
MSKWGKISYLVSGLSLVVLFIARFILGGWIGILWAPLILFFVALIAAWAIDYKFYLEFFTMRTTKHGMNMGSLIVMALVLVVAVNYFSIRYNKTIDLTEEKLHSLSEQSVQVLNDLKDDVKVLVFYRGARDNEAKNNIKQRFQLFLDSSPKLKYQTIDALVDAAKAKEYLKSTSQATVFLEVGSRRTEVQEPFDEEKITSALIKVTRANANKVYFLTGHGEKDIDGQGQKGLKELKNALEGANFTVAKLNLLKGDAMPTDTDSVVAIIGPELPLLDSELQQLRSFARQGGKFLLALDPGQRHQLANLTKTFGVEFKNNYIISDRVQLLGMGTIAALGTEFSLESNATKKFESQNNYAIFILASEVVRAPDAPTDLRFIDLVKSEPSAFQIPELKQGLKPGERKAYTLAVSVDGSLDKKPEGAPEASKEKSFSAIIYGDSEFMSDEVLYQGVNRDLIMNSFAHLVQDEGLISIRPKQPKGSQLTMTRNQQIGAVAAGVSLPLLLIIGAGVFWYRRKNL